ncbi:hypothetical protein BT93_E1820 [Corymbia citriodora subsp. variegata]|nr:hypothetical protein BT93_E1820 [Corymbia citriodora subsp. variegata]
MVNWEKLPREVLELIARRLAIEDFLPFRRVCASWRSAAVKETYNTKSKALWFMIHVDDQRAELFSPSRGRISPMRLLESRVETWSPRGWLLVSKWSCEYHILNPLLRLSIKLPALEKLRHKSCLREELDGSKRLQCPNPRIRSIAWASSPSSSRSYRVMISINQSWITGLVFHRSGEDAWTVVSPAMHLASNSRQIIFESHPCLVECLGSFLAAWTIWGKGHGPVKKIRVFKVDLEKRTQEEIKSLGNTSLFLNSNSSFSVEFNANQTTSYIDEKKKSYSVDNGKVGTHFDATSCRDFAAVWFQPDFSTLL